MRSRTNGIVSIFLPPHLRDRELLPVLEAGKILTDNGESIDSIRQSAGIADSLFETLYLHPITRTAGLVQSCPASQAGHHAWPGGLMDHILSSCAFALRIRKGVILPMGSTPEKSSRMADLYTYAVFAAALLHEIGPAMDTRRIAHFDRWGRYLGERDPLLDDIGPGRPRARYLKIGLRPAPASRSGNISSLMYVSRLLTKEGILWIRGDPEVYGDFLGAFSDAPGGPIHGLLKKGIKASVDRASGSRNSPSPDAPPGNPGPGRSDR